MSDPVTAPIYRGQRVRVFAGGYCPAFLVGEVGTVVRTTETRALINFDCLVDDPRWVNLDVVRLL